MPAPDLEIVAGTTFGFEVTWEDGSGTQTPIDISGCAVRFQVRTGTDKLLVDCSTENGCIEVTDPATGTIAVQVKPEQTRGHYPSQWEGADYELRVYFPSGDVYSILRGRAKLLRGAIHD
ncbi:hypothetical protein AYI72_22445 [Shewanella algae]|uniref:hypothetical protein n=1 Tax=Gammaproteobacteria TaxID=1236 RepID=UPI001184185E|nr:MULTISPECIES: hypothetical protein [Gammaproteobacteria]EAZ2875447.1 hypothetical protein [Salmonella enterica]MCF9733001.1 hypothetical protein [Vibrio parahaemolyticus]ELN1084976.1 hypothetical protein [Salmonella enterica]MCF9748054.1 hypothetical protein [Vibrio parahaemolyticus]MCF9901293.1 hypothetical protein [Vibrio parahaemolyticus]